MNKQLALKEEFDELQKTLPGMQLRAIGQVIRDNWAKIYFGAVPYLDAICELNSIQDNYGQDSGKSIVVYFLGNATTWRGPVARMVKAELNKRVKG